MKMNAEDPLDLAVCLTANVGGINPDHWVYLAARRQLQPWLEPNSDTAAFNQAMACAAAQDGVCVETWLERAIRNLLTATDREAVLIKTRAQSRAIH